MEKAKAIIKKEPERNEETKEVEKIKQMPRHESVSASSFAFKEFIPKPKADQIRKGKNVNQQRKRQTPYNVHRDPNVVGYHPRHGRHRHPHQYEREVKYWKMENGMPVKDDDEPEFVSDVKDYWSKG